jgi:YidC/Oxa1 family membrane protein insertase
MNNNRNFIFAIALSAAVLFGWQYFFAMPKMRAEQARQAQIALQQKKPAAPAGVVAPIVPQAAAPQAAAPAAAPANLPRAKALLQGGTRIPIVTPTVDGSLRLTGARFDDLRLRQYRATVDPRSAEIELLSPSGSHYPYFVQIGWSVAGGNAVLPDDKTPWQLTEGSALSPGKPVTLSWDNGHGLVFVRKIEIDGQYMFTVTDSVTNRSGARVNLFPYALVQRDRLPEQQSSFAHEGFVGIADGTLKDIAYKKFKDDGKAPETFSSTGGWVGITDKYWMAALIPPQTEQYNGAYSASPFGDGRSYQANYTLPGRAVAPGATVSVTHRMFAGAKVVDILRSYEKRDGIQMFDYAIDWGKILWVVPLMPLTKPLFWILDLLNKYLGNLGLAIILATVLIRLLLYPLANVSFKSMIKMKKVQPEMERIKKACEGDQQKLQQAMMEMYKREKVNPMAGCLPMLIQIPILFAFYTVMYVSIEMYHAPFYGWIRDLSAGDPTSFINLFGLLPFSVPQSLPWGLNFLGFFLHVGVWPLLMGLTQWVQTKMNPAPADPMQAKMFALMPWMFMFMMAAFPAGLVIYWTWNNVLSMAQQYIMMKRENVPVHLFDNLRQHAFVRKLIGLTAKTGT